MTKPQLIQVSDFVRSLLPREMLLRLDGDGDFEIKAPDYWYPIERSRIDTTDKLVLLGFSRPAAGGVRGVRVCTPYRCVRTLSNAHATRAFALTHSRRALAFAFGKRSISNASERPGIKRPLA
jgi:hypothetical protein